VMATITVVPTFIGPTGVVYGPAITTTVTISPNFLASGAVVFNPTLSFAGVIIPDFLGSTAVVYIPTILVSSVGLEALLDLQGISESVILLEATIHPIIDLEADTGIVEVEGELQ
jgi:hypothetical protein